MTKASPNPNSFPPFLFISFPAEPLPHGSVNDPKQSKYTLLSFHSIPYSKPNAKKAVREDSLFWFDHSASA